MKYIAIVNGKYIGGISEPDEDGILLLPVLNNITKRPPRVFNIETKSDYIEYQVGSSGVKIWDTEFIKFTRVKKKDIVWIECTTDLDKVFLDIIQKAIGVKHEHRNQIEASGSEVCDCQVNC